MITVDIPASFECNDSNFNWVKNYLMPKAELFTELTNGSDLDLEHLDETQFKQLCQILETTAEGRELRNKMFKAWRSKKSRDSDNGKKLYTFNLSIKAGDQLKQIAQHAPINKTLELIIFNAGSSFKTIEKLQQQVNDLKEENITLQQQLSKTTMLMTTESDESQAESILSDSLQITELAKLEKSQLIKQILNLKRKLT
ncbi:hypothetical protein N8878_00215 [Psychromonas sp.]|nr:hypothetical protein [Psychromonas sp.]